MKDQLTLLRETPWDVLVILDACRADAFQQMLKHSREQRADSRQQATNTVLPAAGCPPPADCCRSPGNCTADWLTAVAPMLVERGVRYFSANPVVDREIAKSRLGIKSIPLWKYLWGHFTPDHIPSVHPLCVNGAVLQWVRDRQALQHNTSLDMVSPVVVHYLQPHSPYIGSPPLALGRWGRGKGALHQACHGLMQPQAAVERGLTTWPEVREAYLGNLRLAWDAVLALAREMEGRRIVVTSDHGELLGEHGGKFGHEANWREPQLYEVPWLELSREAYSAEASSAAKAGQVADSSQDTTKQKLEALGYV